MNTNQLSQELVEELEKCLTAAIRSTVHPKWQDDVKQELWISLLKALPKHDPKHSLVALAKHRLRWIIINVIREYKKQGFTFTEPNKQSSRRRVCPDPTCKHDWRPNGWARNGKKLYRCCLCKWRVQEYWWDNGKTLEDFQKCERTSKVELLCNTN